MDKIQPQTFINLTGQTQERPPDIKKDSDYTHYHKAKAGGDGTYNHYQSGLELALDLLESRQRIYDSIYHSATAVAVLDELKVHLEATLLRVSKGEYPHATSTVE